MADDKGITPERAAEIKAAEKPAPPVEPTPELSLFDRAKLKAPNLTPEFVAEYNLDDDYLQRIAVGLEPPPPTIGPVHTVDLHRTDGGWQITPVGVKPEDVGKAAISR